jgi:anti-sigma B factor antagonist
MSMSAPDPAMKHLRLRYVDGVVVIDVLSKDIQGPDRAKEFIAELMSVAEEECDQPILVNLRRTIYLSSMGYSGLFKLVKCAKERQRVVKICNMHPDVRVGADVVGLPHVVEFHDSEEVALLSFAQS